MGSLMAGWNSPSFKSSTVRLERNKSLTKAEIEAFKKMQGGSSLFQDEQRLNVPQNCSQGTDSGKLPSSPATSPRFVLRGSEYAVDVEKASKTDAWWTRSSWAFLNEPPTEMSHKPYNYKSQFHVAN